MECKDVYELTNPQKSIYCSEQFSHEPVNNIIGTMFFTKDLNIELLKKAVYLTVQNNQALRTILVEESNEPKQYFKDFTPFPIEVFDFSKESKKEFEKFRQNWASQKFQLYGGNLFDFIICILPNGEIALVAKFHHLIVDAWSLGLVIDFIAISYSNLTNSTNIQPVSGNYTNFIDREQQYLSSKNYINNKNFWEEKLKDTTPISLKNSSSMSHKARRINFEFTQKQSSKINDFCTKHRISPYTLFLGALNIYFDKISDSGKYTIQTPILNRLGKEKNTIGMFINMISIPLQNNMEMSVLSFLQELSTDSISYFKNSKYPYLHLLEDLRKDKHAQNYHIVYSFQNMRAKTDIPNLVPYKAEWNFIGYMDDEFVVNVTDINNSGKYNISYDYLVDLFTTKEVHFINERIKHIITEIITHPTKLVSNISVIPEKEMQLLSTFNKTESSYDDTKTFIDLFEEIVSLYPENTAIVYKDKRYSYSELNNMASIIASNLENLNISNSKVAVLCKKSVFMVASLLGIMKSGNAYIPIDVEYPTERIEYIMKNSNVKTLITTEKYADLYDTPNKIIIDDLDFTTTLHYTNISKPDSLAYMIYTSGTTGNPKGVKIKHKNILNTLVWRKNYYNFNPEIVVLQVPSFSFDSSVEDIFTPLISGATLVIPTVARTDINIICEELVKNKVNHFLVVPSLYKILLREKLECLSTLKFVTIAGESFLTALVKEHFKKLPNVRLINEYGPTENSVCSTFYELTKNNSTVYIGSPIANTKCYVLNEKKELLPIGYKGELYVSGPGVSEGYLGRPELNKEKFLNNPFDSEYKMYKTGDIVLRHFDGNLEFIGRDDDQVKLHGLRIELKEIEQNILQNKGILDCVVVVKENSNKKQILIAYVITRNNNFNVTNLYEQLKKKLPFYMIPVIMKLEKFPLTPNGKIDKSKLPMPNSSKTYHTLPRTELEHDILSVCQDVLQNHELGIYEDFFTDGNADSLSILTINSRLFAKGIKIQTQDFYKYSTVEALAKYISTNNKTLVDNPSNMIKPKLTAFPENISQKDLTFPFKNILLTGVTGFLGVHILDYLLKNTQSIVYCIIREKYHQAPQKRLVKILSYYFDNQYYQNYQNRIIIVEGELSKEFFGLSQEDYSNLQKNVDCIINTAANTRHYGNYSIFERENVDTVKNLILFAKPADILLNHMSTTNVSGNFLVENDIHYHYTENDFYIGQNYQDNVYIHSKFEAEKLIIEQEYQGLRANIFRLGNLMARYSDGKFQKNKLDNAYYTRLLAFAKIGYIPENLKDQLLEFSPIDETAECIIKLLSIPNLENNIFHIFSDKLIPLTTLLNTLKQYGCTYKFTSYKNFMKHLNLPENEKNLKYIVSDLNLSRKFDYSSDIVIDNNLTNQFLDFVGFKWSEIDENYLKRFFDNANFIKDINE